MTEWIDGPSLVNWIEERSTVSEAIAPSALRRIREWREGGSPDLYTVDKVLTKLDLHLSEVPPEMIQGGEGMEPPKGRGGTPPGYGCKLTDAQIRVLHRLQTERNLTVKKLSEEIWEGAGYASPQSAAWAISNGFRRLGLDIAHHGAQAFGARRCGALTYRGRPCRQFALPNSDVCWSHHPDHRDQARAQALQNSPFAADREAFPVVDGGYR